MRFGKSLIPQTPPLQYVVSKHFIREPNIRGLESYLPVFIFVVVVSTCIEVFIRYWWVLARGIY